MKVLIRAPMSDKRVKELKAYYDEVVYSPWTVTGERYYEDEMLQVLCEQQPDILITELDQITDTVLKGYPKLRMIGDCRAVPANIDAEACTKYHVPIICTPARNAQAVSEMLVGLLISYMRQIIPSVQWIKENGWIENTTPYYTWMGNELQGKHVGFVGFGAVGRASAKLLEAFGCEISYYDPYVDFVKDEYHKKELQELFANCDIVSIHLPVTETTIGIIDKKLLSKMKKDAIFMNTARSAVVNQDDLLEVARKHAIKGIILDVLEHEPPTLQDLEINAFDWVLVTPHICGATYEVTEHQSDIITERLLQWEKGINVSSIVYNKDVLKDM